MATLIHLMVTQGPASGREIHVPPDGVRIGRSSKNDISIADETMSRFQCRFFLKPGEGLWVSDLGSVNGTFVNGAPVQEQRLKLQDEILAGDTHIRVIHAGDGEVVPVYVSAALARFWDRQPSFRLYQYQGGRINYWTLYPERSKDRAAR